MLRFSSLKIVPPVAAVISKPLVMRCVKRAIALSGLSGRYTKLIEKATNEPVPALKYSTNGLASSLQHLRGG